MEDIETLRTDLNKNGFLHVKNFFTDDEIHIV